MKKYKYPQLKIYIIFLDKKFSKLNISYLIFFINLLLDNYDKNGRM